MVFFNFLKNESQHFGCYLLQKVMLGEICQQPKLCVVCTLSPNYRCMTRKLVFGLGSLCRWLVGPIFPLSKTVNSQRYFIYFHCTIHRRWNSQGLISVGRHWRGLLNLSSHFSPLKCNKKLRIPIIPTQLMMTITKYTPNVNHDILKPLYSSGFNQSDWHFQHCLCMIKLSIL